MKDFFSRLIRREYEKGFISFEAVTLAYIVLTTVMIIVEWSALRDPVGMLKARGWSLALIAAQMGLYRLYPCRVMVLIRTTFMFLLLIYWYPETYEFCSIFNYQDHIFAAIDYRVFGCQPSMVFDQLLSSTFWYELFNMGYYSYYYIMIATVAFYLFARYERYEWACFVFIASFFMFYFIFEFLPVAGPQYYYCVNGTEMGMTDQFPEMGHYFRDHREILPLEVRGFFSKMVLVTQETGENPTAAFPSSHVGMTTVTMLLAWKSGSKRLFWILLPFAVILFFATVYVKAHYAVDSVFGLVFGCLFYALNTRLFNKARKPLYIK